MVVMSERLEKRHGTTLASFPPPIFVGTASVSVFCVSPPPRLRNTEGEGVFISDILGQAEHQETKMDGIGGSSLKRAWVARPGLVAAPPMLLWASWTTSLTSCAPDGYRDKILTPRKSQINLSSGRFLKHQNT
jgi:hypothetical protein